MFDYGSTAGCDQAWDTLKERGFSSYNLELAFSMVKQSLDKYGSDSRNLALSADVKVAVSDWRSAVDTLAILCDIDLTTTPATLKTLTTQEAAKRVGAVWDRVSERKIQCDEPSLVDEDCKPAPAGNAPAVAAKNPEYRLRIVWRYYKGRTDLPDSLLYADDIGGMYQQFITRMRQEGFERSLDPNYMAALASKKFAIDELKPIIYGENGILRTLELCDHIFQIELNTDPGSATPKWQVHPALAQSWNCVCTFCRNGAHTCDRQCWRRRPTTSSGVTGATGATVDETGNLHGRRRAYSDMSEMSVEYHSTAPTATNYGGAVSFVPRPRAGSDVYPLQEGFVNDASYQKREWEKKCECCNEERQGRTGDAKLMHCVEPGCVKSFHKKPCSRYEKYRSGMVKVYCREHMPKCEGCQSYKQPETNDCSLMRCCEESCRKYFHKAPCSAYDKFRSGCIRVFCKEHYDVHGIGQRRRSSSFAGVPSNTSQGQVNSPMNMDLKRRKLSLSSAPNYAPITVAPPPQVYKGMSMAENTAKLEQDVALSLLALKHQC